MTAILRTIGKLPFVVGVARTLDLLGTMNQPNPYRQFDSAAEADMVAVASDWQAVGDDLASAMVEVGAEIGAE